ncbi:MAG TPA: HD domain-containing phosphohydrolase [Pirellulales bacterium]|nr:HD domain-containing phosphohydrolase [Pirellulales bacterium]
MGMQVIQRSEAQATGRLASCVVCSCALPLRLPGADEQGEDWCCAQCGTTYLAVIDEASPPELRQNVRRYQSSVPSQSASASSAMLGHAYQPQGVARTALPARAGITCGWETVVSRRLDDEISREADLSAVPQGPAFATLMRRPPPTAYVDTDVARFMQTFEDSTAQLEKFFQAMHSGRTASVTGMETIAQQGLERISEDRDLFVALGLNPPPGDIAGRHSLHTAMLAISIGATLGYDDRTLVELGIGCLIHDLGMLRVERARYQDNRILGNTDFREIAKHPLYTFDLLRQQLDWIPRASRMVAYQMHERCNGSGYPRGRTAKQIHELAKVAAVADVFLALCSTRPHRPALMPYYALERMLHGVKDGLFDAVVVRALLKTVSLFPVGSFVRISDGRIGKVLRSNGEDYARPVVAAWKPGTDPNESIVVDLSQEPDLRVIAALATAEFQAPAPAAPEAPAG